MTEYGPAILNLIAESDPETLCEVSFSSNITKWGGGHLFDILSSEGSQVLPNSLCFVGVLKKCHEFFIFSLYIEDMFDATSFFHGLPLFMVLQWSTLKNSTVTVQLKVYFLLSYANKTPLSGNWTVLCLEKGDIEKGGQILFPWCLILVWKQV